MLSSYVRNLYLFSAAISVKIVTFLPYDIHYLTAPFISDTTTPTPSWLYSFLPPPHPLLHFLIHFCHHHTQFPVAPFVSAITTPTPLLHYLLSSTLPTHIEHSLFYIRRLYAPSHYLRTSPPIFLHTLFHHISTLHIFHASPLGMLFILPRIELTHALH